VGTGGSKNILKRSQLLWRIPDAIRQRIERRQLTSTQAMGRRGEDIAHRFLREKGFEILARRFRVPDGKGEIDIIARQQDILVFVEVKTRRNADFGGPERAIGAEKERKIVRAARSYLLKAGADWSRVRFDVVTVVLHPAPVVKHYSDAFFPGRTL
jgi:putative endonuclease